MSSAGAPWARKGSMRVHGWMRSSRNAHPVALRPQTRAAALRSWRLWFPLAGRMIHLGWAVLYSWHVGQLSVFTVGPGFAGNVYNVLRGL